MADREGPHKEKKTGTEAKMVDPADMQKTVDLLEVDEARKRAAWEEAARKLNKAREFLQVLTPEEDASIGRGQGNPNHRPGASQGGSERPARPMAHSDVIAMVAGVLREAGQPLKLARIHELLIERSQLQGFALPGQGSRGNIGVHLSEATYPDIHPVKRIGRGMYGLDGRD